MSIITVRNIIKTALFLLIFALPLQLLGEEKIYPDKPVPSRLVNDFAHCLNGNEVAQLENKLDEFARNTSTQITIVSIANLGGRDISEYTLEVFNRWGLGQVGKNNGVLILVSIEDQKGWIAVGSGLEGVLTDAKTGLVFRNEIVPAFREKRYFDGLSNAADAVIAVSKGEYTNEGLNTGQESKGGTAVIVIIVVIMIIIWMFRSRGGGRGGGGIYHNSGYSGFFTGMLLGDLLGGGLGGRGSDDSGGWGGGDGGGFGGFGGGGSSGGGAGGSW